MGGTQVQRSCTFRPLAGDKPRLRRTRCFSSLESPAKDLEGQLVTVLGLGVSGRAAVKLALARGAYVVAIDKKNEIPALQEDSALSSPRLLLQLGGYDEKHVLNAQRIVVSPGVSLECYNLRYLMHRGHPVVSELDFASEKLSEEIKLIAVTGTNGKSTITSFTGQVLEHAGVPCFTGGNLGVPLCDAALSYMESCGSKNPFQVAQFIGKQMCSTTA